MPGLYVYHMHSSETYILLACAQVITETKAIRKNYMAAVASDRYVCAHACMYACDCVSTYMYVCTHTYPKTLFLVVIARV